MQFEHTQVYNFENAFRGMRNPLNSWDKSDSFFGLINLECDFPDADMVVDSWIDNENISRIERGLEPLSENMEDCYQYYVILDRYCSWMRDVGILRVDNDLADVAFLGYEDLRLAQKLIKAGPEHAKFMRQIIVSVDITAPLYWWKEFDTYKIGTTANSTSTMHKLTSKPITLDSFETNDYDKEWFEKTGIEAACDTWVENNIIYFLETLREEYIKTGDKRYWKELIRWLPESFIQTRTWTANYAVLRNICFQRKGHKLKEWDNFCHWIKNLPYAQELILIGENNEIN